MSIAKTREKKFFFSCNEYEFNVEFDFLGGVLMEDNFNKHLGNQLKLRRLALGLTQTKVAKAINVTFQQIQKYEKGTNGVSSIRLLQLSNFLKVPINYFYENYQGYIENTNLLKETVINVNYNFLKKIYNELNEDQKTKFRKSISIVSQNYSQTG
tara:strand:- start:45 stop:509 length:465 start_codon:yes stop_codon:yes gene_type:complete